MPNAPQENIAIVGGGIAGLFCALILEQQGKAVHLFETSERIGGRIRTLRLDKKNTTLDKDNWKNSELEFYAEFGPMRVELDRQHLLKALLTYLDIKSPPVGTSEKNDARLVDFPSYASPASSHDPQYELRPDEEDKNPLELLKMAMLRIIVNVDVYSSSGFLPKKKKLIEEITLASALQQSVDKVFTQWLQDLNNDDYWDIQTEGRIGNVPLYTMGFWNLLSDYLSHNAILKLRDLGTFYHLLPENPNAAEWFVWWLIGFSISERLQGIYGGMECIVDNLEKKLNTVTICKNSWVKRIEKTDSGQLKLIFDETKKPEREDDRNRAYKHVILALPKRALQQVQSQSVEAFAQEREITDLLNSAFGFPMVKMFMVVKERWWEEEFRANRYATRIPTRELHYWKGRSQNSKQGLIMAYTDRPASAFWSNYVPPGAQIDVHRPVDKDLPHLVLERLKKKLAQYLNDNNVPDITADDIVWYGIRDWGRQPYGGANHAWRPERKYWVVMRRLAEIPVAVSGKDCSSIHICGEAYSDYHGFMEGSLRSAVYVLHRILDQAPRHTFEGWLDDDNNSGLRVENSYLKSLQHWAEKLDGINGTDSYL